MTCTHVIAAALLVAGALMSGPGPAWAQTPPPALTPEEIRAYEDFRAWMGSQPKTMQDAADEVVYRSYADALRAKGIGEREAAATIDALKGIGDRAEIDRWNRILTAPKPAFNTAPNAFLVSVIKDLKPGRALDVGMGQGRNAIYLAQQGWDSVGFDPADRAVALATEQAAKLGLKLTAHVARAEDFDWGTSQWDLIVFSYVGARGFVTQVERSLRPGGVVVVEGFHRDAAKTRPIGGAVVFDTNELLKLFASLRVLRYEDMDGPADFGQSTMRIVRLAAQKR